MTQKVLHARGFRRSLGLAASFIVMSLLFFPVITILADRNEVIVSIEVLDRESGHAAGGGVRITSASSGTQFILSGQHTTVAEGETVTLEAMPDAGTEFFGWDQSFPGNQKEITTAFYADTTIRAIITRVSGDDSPDDDDSETSRPFGAAGGGFGFPNKPTSTESLKSTSSRSISVIWVDFQHLGIEDGTNANPFNTTAEGVSAIGATTADTINFKPGVSQETITINSAMTLDAPNGAARIGVSSFAVSYTLTTSVTGSGSVTGAGGYSEGTNATVNANASTGWAFSHWEGDLSGFADPDTILMDSDKAVTAVFVQNPANLEVTSVELSGGGALPTEATAGDVLTLEWDVLNDSGNTASSGDTDWTDNVFLSRDSSFDGQDKALNMTGATVTGPVSGSGTYMASVSITIPDASPGDYFLIVRTDAGEEVTHTASDRATGILASAITLIDPELTQ